MLSAFLSDGVLMKCLRVLFSLLVLGVIPVLYGCGWGGNPQDFAVTATPASVPVQAGASGQTVTFKVQNLLYFNAPVAITLTPPDGIVCSVSPCTVTASSTSSQAITFRASAMTPVGSYSVLMRAVSGTISHDGSLTVTVLPAATSSPAPTPPVPAPDFTFSVNPAATTVTAGTATLPYSFQVTRSNGQTASITVTSSLPAGFSCSASPCGAVVSGSASGNAFTLTPALTVAPGTYTATFTGTDGVNTHVVGASVTVAAAPNQAPPVTPAPVATAPPVAPSGCRTTAYVGDAPHSPDGMRFAYTGAASLSPQHFEGLSHLVYDSMHNVVFESNASLNEVDVISPNDMTLIQRIPVPEPTGMDLSPDGKTLYVASLSPYFYSIDTSLFCVAGRAGVMADLRGNLTMNTSEELLVPLEVAALSDGSVAVLLIVHGSGAGAVALWTPQGSRTLATNVYGGMVRSGDRKHLFIWGNGTSGSLARYDASTGTIVATPAKPYFFPEVYAVNQDGSRLLGLTDCCALSLMDFNLNVLASANVRFPSVLAGPDFSRFYVHPQDAPPSQLNVLDGSTLALLGSIPAPTQDGPGDWVPSSFDGSGRILIAVDSGMDSVPVVPPVPGLAGPDIDQGLIPAIPFPSLATSLNGAGLTASPLVTFNGSPATNVQYVNVNVINLTAPSLDTDCVDVEAMFPNGSAAMQPWGYCYRPRILYLSGDAGPSAGGGKLTLYGIGVSDTRVGAAATRVLIGGVDATAATVQGGGSSASALETTQLTVTAPPGHAGTADIEVIAPGGGSTLLPHAYTYADTAVTALSSSVSPVEMIFDKSRQRVLISDKANGQVLVYDAVGKQMRNSIAVGTSPRGIGLTPDGSQLLVLTAGDRKISVYDADSYALVQQASVPALELIASLSEPLGDPQWVLPLVNDKALVLAQPGMGTGYWSGLTLGETFVYDLQTNQMALQAALSTNQQPLNGTVTPDGTFAVLGNDSYDAVTGTAKPIALDAYTSVALTPDGSRYLAGTGPVVDRSGVPQNFLSTYDLLTGINATIQPVGAGQVSGGNSLFYQPANNGIRVWDVQHGTLVQNVALPGSAGLYNMPDQKLLAVDPAGGRAWTVNANGLIDVQFAQDPLSIGGATVIGGQVSVQGSGFTSTMQVSIDGHPVTATATGTTAFTVPLPALATGNHAIQITDGGNRAYTLDLAFATP